MVRALPARDLVPADLDGGDVLLALGREDCPACMVLGASMGVLARAYPECAVWSVQFADPADWAVREALLWPRNITISRAAMPSLVLMHDGELRWQHHGSLPAHAVIDALRPHLGDPQIALTGLDATEEAVRLAVAPRRAQLIRARGTGPMP